MLTHTERGHSRNTQNHRPEMSKSLQGTKKSPTSKATKMLLLTNVYYTSYTLKQNYYYWLVKAGSPTRAPGTPTGSLWVHKECKALTSFTGPVPRALFVTSNRAGWGNVFPQPRAGCWLLALAAVHPPSSQDLPVTQLLSMQASVTGLTSPRWCQPEGG